MEHVAKRQKINTEGYQDDNSVAIDAFNKGCDLFWKRLCFKSKEYFEKAASMNYPPAYLFLLQIHCTDETKEQKYKEECMKHKDWFITYSTTNNPYYEYLMGLYLTLVEGDCTDYDWYQKAAQKGYAPAQCEIGLLDLEDEKTQEQGVKWLLKAAEQGFCAAMSWLSVERKFTEDIWLYWLEKAAESGHALAQLTAAQLYENGQHKNGHETVRKNLEKSSMWLMKSVEQGLPEAELEYAKRLQKEEQVWMYWVEASDQQKKKEKEKWIKIAHWTQMAASKDHAVGQYELARLYEHGAGVAQDFQKAVYWYTQSAEKGCTMASHWLGKLYEEGTKVPRDYPKALEYYMKVPDRSSIGRFYYYGLGVKQDYGMAAEWLEYCGYDEAYMLLARCYEYGEGVPQDMNKAIELTGQLIKIWHSGFAYRLHNRLVQVNKVERCSKEETEVVDEEDEDLIFDLLD